MVYLRGVNPGKVSSGSSLVDALAYLVTNFPQDVVIKLVKRSWEGSTNDSKYASVQVSI